MIRERPLRAALPASSRLVAVAVTVAVVAGLLVVWILFAQGRHVGRLEAQVERLSEAYDATRPPEAPPPSDVASGEEPPPQNGDGVDGRNGVDGRDGVDGVTPACWFTTSQCVGRSGVDGRDSTVPGPSGPAGADSTTPGPQGDTGSPGADSTVPGPQGEKGDTGGPGADSTVPGPQGEQGPAPDSFTFEWATQTYTCRDDDGDGAYTCEQSGLVEPEPAP